MKNFGLIVLMVFIIQSFSFGQNEFLRHDGYYTFEDHANGKSVNLFVENAGTVYWVDGPQKFHAKPIWFKNQNVNKCNASVSKNKIMITIEQPNHIVIKAIGKIWYKEIKFKLKYYKGKKKINTQWMTMKFIPFED